MANPKHKLSRLRTRRRRANDRFQAPTLMDCPNCKEKKPAHIVCPSCGHYKGEEVYSLEETESKA